MRIRTTPPRTSIFFGEIFLILQPKVAPTNDKMKVTVPMTIMGLIMEIFRRAKLKPTAKASMLVATERIRSVQKPRFPFSTWASGFVVS